VNSWLKPRDILVAAVLFLGIHAAASAAFPATSSSVSYGFFLIASLAALVLCCRRALTCDLVVRRNWMLVCVALLLWFAGTFMAARMQVVQHISPASATLADFLYFFYGVPIMLALSSPEESRLVPLFFWLDGVQAVVAGFLAYIAIFSVVPFSGAAQHPISVSLLVWTYDVENLILAGGATLRLLASPRDAQDRRLFQILSIFLWTYGACATIYNHIVVAVPDAGVLDVLVDLPFIALAVAVIWLPVVERKAVPLIRRKPLALFIDNARPVIFAMALVALGAAVSQRHFIIGMLAIGFAMALYGLRSTMLQGRYLRSQQALEEAKERLEEMALMDGLTGIANRRCFDQRLELEWGRANRLQSPLSLLMIDIDSFKNLNDTQGHRAGDECLVKVAAALRLALTRGGDLLARYGGEEFAALLPGTDADGARTVALRMQTAIRILEVTNPTAVGPRMTISIGISTYELTRRGSPAQLVDSADGALYKAKQGGRNRIEVTPMQARAMAGMAANNAVALREIKAGGEAELET